MKKIKSKCEICGEPSKELFLNKNEKLACKNCKDSNYIKIVDGHISDEQEKLNRLSKKYGTEFIEPKSVSDKDW